MKNGKLVIILGVLGFIAGIVLIFSDNWVMGVAGSIASAGLVYSGYKKQ